MRRTEIILVAIWLIFILLLGTGFTGRMTLLIISTTTLSFYYLFRSPKIFAGNPALPKVIPVIAGVALATAIFTVPWFIKLRDWDWLFALPWINIVFVAALFLFILITKIKRKPLKHPYPAMLIRGSILLVITCLLLFKPLWLSPYRNVLIFLNEGNKDLQSNLQMFGYKYKFDKYLAENNCDKAIENASLAFEKGLEWLGLDTAKFPDWNLKHLYMIQGTYTALYEAYKCKADRLKDMGQYERALNNYIKADSFLHINPEERFIYWRKRRADAKNNIGICYDQLDENEKALNYYMEAIQYYVDSVKLQDHLLATFYTNMGSVLSKLNDYENSSKAYLASIDILNSDTTIVENLHDISTNYLLLCGDRIKEYNFLSARKMLKMSRRYLDEDDEFRYNLYATVLNQKFHQFDSALFYSHKLLDRANNMYTPNDPRIASIHSIKTTIFIDLPDYDSAAYHLEKALAITAQNYPPTSTSYQELKEKEATLDYLFGDYFKSLDNLKTVLSTYSNEFGKDHHDNATLHSILAQNYLELGNLKEAVYHMKECARLCKIHDYNNEVVSSPMLNTIARVNLAAGNIKAADTLFQHVLQINEEYWPERSLPAARALNGLAIIAHKRSKYQKADSLFKTSIATYEKYYPDYHPNLAIVEMNYAQLNMEVGNLSTAMDLLEKALAGYEKFYNDDHPDMAEILLVMAEVKTRMNEKDTAIQYLEQARSVLVNFPWAESKVAELERRIGRAKKEVR